MNACMPYYFEWKWNLVVQVPTCQCSVHTERWTFNVQKLYFHPSYTPHVYTNIKWYDEQ